MNPPKPPDGPPAVVPPDSAATPPKARRGRKGKINLGHRIYFLNRELSWLEFNRRVLEEALDPANLLLERVKFLSIFASNLDEFFMIRVSGLRNQLTAGAVKAPPDGMTPAEQLAEIRERLLPMLDIALRCWARDLEPKLRDAGITALKWDELKNKQKKLLRRHFKSDILPVLTPLAFDPGHPFPHISNLSLNLAVVVQDPERGRRFARVKVPQVFPRLLRIPSEDRAGTYERLGLEELSSTTFVWIEEVIAANLDLLFPGLEVTAAYPFRVTRDADLEIEEDEASDLLAAMLEVVGQRRFGSAIRLEVDTKMPADVREVLLRNLRLAPFLLYAQDGPVGIADLAELTRLDRPELKDPPMIPATPPALSGDGAPFAAIRQRDVLLYHPYDSFAPVVDFLNAAAHDPKVLAIKQTLYRVGPNSPVVAALMDAREHGKQVAVLVELKARFDEENNIGWARSLEHAGVHVVYGLVGLKTHAKMCLVVRREADGIRRYVHLGTGNYNPVTARIYGDLGLFTCDPEIASDVSDLFNALTGYSRKTQYQRLLVAPTGMREGILSRIEREIAAHKRTGHGRLVFKMNGLVDKACIMALYRASQAGVRVDLQVRSICCLRPGVPGVSETITVTSVVGRFLEHSRIFWFANGGDEEVLIGSADLMPRNLDGRVEVLVPVRDPGLVATLRDEILKVHLADTAKNRRLLPDGGHERIRPADGTTSLDSQLWMIRNRQALHEAE